MTKQMAKKSCALSILHQLRHLGIDNIISVAKSNNNDDDDSIKTSMTTSMQTPITKTTTTTISTAQSDATDEKQNADNSATETPEIILPTLSEPQFPITPQFDPAVSPLPSPLITMPKLHQTSKLKLSSVPLKPQSLMPLSIEVPIVVEPPARIELLPAEILYPHSSNELDPVTDDEEPDNENKDSIS